RSARVGIIRRVSTWPVSSATTPPAILVPPTSRPIAWSVVRRPLSVVMSYSELSVVSCQLQDLRSRHLQGGLEGRSPSKIASFWPVSATNVAETGQKGEISGAVAPPPNPHRVSPVSYQWYARRTEN